MLWHIQYQMTDQMKENQKQLHRFLRADCVDDEATNRRDNEETRI